MSLIAARYAGSSTVPSGFVTISRNWAEAGSSSSASAGAFAAS